jgi:ABC-type polysaccharide/polyol phosphate export permease
MSNAAVPAEVHAARAPFADRARDRALFANFFRRELITRYLGSITGLAWALLNPIALLAVYHFVFTEIFPARGFGGSSFLAFLAVALWPWLATQEAIQRGTTALPDPPLEFPDWLVDLRQHWAGAAPETSAAD